jgi:hypothetical protein
MEKAVFFLFFSISSSAFAWLAQNRENQRYFFKLHKIMNNGALPSETISTTPMITKCSARPQWPCPQEIGHKLWFEQLISFYVPQRTQVFSMLWQYEEILKIFSKLNNLIDIGFR